MPTLDPANRSTRITAGAIVVILVSAHALVAVTPFGEELRRQVSGSAYLVSILAAFTATAYVRTRLAGRERYLWMFMVLSMAAFSVAAAWRTYYLFMWGVRPPIGSLEDVGLVAGMLLLVPVIISLGGSKGIDRFHRTTRLLDMVAVLVLTFALTYRLVLLPIGALDPAYAVERSALYLTYTWLMIGFVAYPVIFRRDPWTAWAAIVVGAVAVGAVGVVAMLIASEAGVYEVGESVGIGIDSLFVLAFFLFAIAGVWRLGVPQTVRQQRPRELKELPGWPGFMLGIIAIIGVPFIVYSIVTAPVIQDRALLGVCTAILTVAIASRAGVTIHENRRLLKAGDTLERYRTPLENAPVPITIVDQGMKILYANRAAATLMEVDSTESLLGLDVSKMIAPDQEDSVEYGAIRGMVGKLKRDPSARTKPLPPAHVVIVTLKGHIRDLESTAAAIIYDGKPAVLVQVWDITDRIRTERELSRTADRLRGLAADLEMTEERERKRLAQALHDQVGQPLAVARIRFKAAEADELLGGPNAAVGMSMIDKAIAETRWLTTELAPQVLYELGLNEALHSLAEETRRAHGISVEVVGTFDDSGIEETCSAMAYRSVRELLVNVVKYAHVSEAVLELSSMPDSITVTVTDTGVGFDLSSGISSLAKDSFGLLSIHECSLQLGGSLEIESEPGRGTRATVTMPRKCNAPVFRSAMDGTVADG